MLIHDHKTNWNSFLTTLVSFAFLIFVRIANEKLLPRWKYHKKFPVPIPGALILVRAHPWGCIVVALLKTCLYLLPSHTAQWVWFNMRENLLTL